MPTVDDWLEDLASAAPTPGGGAAGAMNAAIGAALVSMVCNLTIGKPKFAEHEAALTEVLDRATTIRRECLDAAARDEAAFEAVMAAYRLPKQTDEEKAARAAGIQLALVAAAEPPLWTAALAAEVIALADRIEPVANPNVISDVAVAASSARAALEAAMVNVEVNVGAITDEAQRADLLRRLADVGAATTTADDVVARVRRRLT